MTKTIDPLLIVASFAPTAPVDEDRLILARASCERAMTTAFEPHRRPLEAGSPRRGRGWLVAVAAAVVATISLVAFPGPTGDQAFASWTPNPTPLVGESLQDAAEGCRSQQSEFVQGQEGGSVGMPATGAQIADVKPVLAERRGNFTFVLVANDRWLLDCMNGGDIGAHGAVDLADYSREIAGNGVTVFQYEALSSPAVGSAAAVWGRVGTAVTAVDITQTNGYVVHATNGPSPCGIMSACTLTWNSECAARSMMGS